MNVFFFVQATSGLINETLGTADADFVERMDAHSDAVAAFALASSLVNAERVVQKIMEKESEVAPIDMGRVNRKELPPYVQARISKLSASCKLIKVKKPLIFKKTWGERVKSGQSGALRTTCHGLST
uniref:Uncharacterized protein n=1 Tax=Chromera velia CCMP2878 TaxID=1169474 RepID=A0A0G4HAK1_9ALVE|eukprot:Cvel_6042.t1-p1 / transcript=Cvel_6042.t1 / gene=Cvel_6042 / organism=Chromera_velia_CCMP2878 / gene_product=hypothetical protein / transcript_product=hypothetical protein / location=Cvel_scaffold290:40854-41231(-) / protein_length=126 / sequence_SO=supercontig / SO=protein_coding / is_pseudo=false